MQTLLYFFYLCIANKLVIFFQGDTDHWKAVEYSREIVYFYTVNLTFIRMKRSNQCRNFYRQKFSPSIVKPNIKWHIRFPAQKTLKAVHANQCLLLLPTAKQETGDTEIVISRKILMLQHVFKIYRKRQLLKTCQHHSQTIIFCWNER